MTQKLVNIKMKETNIQVAVFLSGKIFRRFKSKLEGLQSHKLGHPMSHRPSNRAGFMQITDHTTTVIMDSVYSTLNRLRMQVNALPLATKPPGSPVLDLMFLLFFRPKFFQKQKLSLLKRAPRLCSLENPFSSLGRERRRQPNQQRMSIDKVHSVKMVTWRH